MKDILMQVENLWICSKAKPLVKNLHFTLASGEAVGLIGESGSGKSLTGLSLLGLLPKELKVHGDISFAGKLLQKDKDFQTRRQRDFSVVFQNPMSSLNPTMQIGEQIAEAMPKPNAGKIVELLQDVEISNPQSALQKYPHEFSGGERQRILIALALAKKPKLLIADEPTTSLDVTIQVHLIGLLKRLQKQYNFCLLFITHDLAIVRALCDRVMVMLGGHLLEVGTTSQVLKAAKHPYTQSLIHSYPRDDLDFRDIPENLHYPPLSSGCPFTMRCPHAMNICLQQYPECENNCWLYDERCRK